jgi:hypothetical protein
MVEMSLNLRFLLWQNEMSGVKESKELSQWMERASKWSKKLAAWAECDTSRAESLLRGAEISKIELDNIKRNKPLNDDEFIALINIELWQNYKNNNNQTLSIWQENIIFLLDRLEHGEKSKLIENLKEKSPKFSNANFSKWEERKHIPNTKYKNIIHHFFNLPNQIDLEKEPLFLSIDPIRIQEKKSWLCQKIQELPEQKVRDFFPALKCLLESS